MTDQQPAFYALDPGVTAFSTTRKGGYSRGAYGEFNINPYCGDDAHAVARNRQMLCNGLRLAGPERLILPHQSHGTAVCLVDNAFLALSSDSQKAHLDNTDALLTAEPEVCIGVSTADCIPILLYDPEHRTAAAVHAGWRGTLKRIAAKAVEEMVTVFGSRPQALKAVVGPGISLKNFEVGDDVYDLFASEGFDMGRVASRFGKWHLNLPFLNQLQLEETGMAGTHIQQCGLCTFDQSERFFSARRLGIRSGRIYTGIVIRNET